ncbi:FKBP-type peptidyl-prolyl cis-trans isomerase [bacterium]|nr:FKBP-type peptidyl-prolyl cis-trans isomerase [bacterium]
MSQTGTIAHGAQVSFEYTLTDEAGEVIDSNVGGEPLQYTHGAREIVIGLERELTDLQVGDRKKVTVEPEEGYGVVDEERCVEIPRAQVPEEALHVGAQLQAVTEDGVPLPATVKELHTEHVVLDMNHPLAGKRLFFDVHITNIEQASA